MSPFPASDQGDAPEDPSAPLPVHYAEQALLGALLLEPHRLQALDSLEPAHFGNPAHSALFAAMRSVPAPDPEQHRKDPAWLHDVLEEAKSETRGLTAPYLHALTQVCPRPQHAVAYAGMIRADHARRTVGTHAEHLAQIATDTTLPAPVPVVLAQADTLARYLDDLVAEFAPHSGSLPRTSLPPVPLRDTSEEALDEERLLLATATAHPDEVKAMRWLRPDDFALPLHGRLYRCLTALAHRGDVVDAVTVLWEAQHQGLLTANLTPAGLMALVSTPTGSPEHWGEKILQRALLHRAHAVSLRIRAFTDDAANTPHQLITGCRRALADLTSVRARWQRTSPQPLVAPRAPRTPAVTRAGPPPRATVPSSTARTTR
ncbi:DnaB-like helicase N-terminal domain-containing protein [Streptomyces sp. NPDC102274]|uniref:DnaB-like helicase N-terminal domain-containing protein n=1 Tax=Streptomyces sp. NPDC102274 TaxID=3366151 RepID=UPI0037F98C8B